MNKTTPPKKAPVKDASLEQLAKSVQQLKQAVAELAEAVKHCRYADSKATDHIEAAISCLEKVNG